MSVSFGPRPTIKSSQKITPKKKSPLRHIVPVLVAALIVAAGLFSLPLSLAVSVKLAEEGPVNTRAFPVTVDPERKVIIEDPEIEAMLSRPPSQLQASVGFLQKAYEHVALAIADSRAFRQVAGVAGVNDLFVRVPAGTRQEEVALLFGRELGWTAAQRKEFVQRVSELEPEIGNGLTIPGVYFASVTEPEDVATLIDNRFDRELLARYGTSTQEVIPIEDALNIAAMIQREAGGWHDMRYISGIMWNRLFAGQRLQLDATLQYVEASRDGGKNGWWPSVEPKDKFIKSPYNTYQNAGLPPGPIANPSIDAIIAALNPKKTDCYFYFHDERGRFFCSKTYQEHVRKLKQAYGQGR